MDSKRTFTVTFPSFMHDALLILLYKPSDCQRHVCRPVQSGARGLGRLSQSRCRTSPTRKLRRSCGDGRWTRNPSRLSSRLAPADSVAKICCHMLVCLPLCVEQPLAVRHARGSQRGASAADSMNINSMNTSLARAAFQLMNWRAYWEFVAEGALQLMNGRAHWEFVAEGSCPSVDEGAGSLGICCRGNTALRHLNSGRGRAAGAAGEMRHHAVQGHRPARCATLGRSVLQDCRMCSAMSSAPVNSGMG